MGFFEKFLRPPLMKEAGEETSSSGSGPSLKEGEILFTDQTAKAKPEEKREDPVKKGDIFENSDGGRIVVERVKGINGEKSVFFTEHSSDGWGLKPVLEKPEKNFRIVAGVKDMKEIDPVQAKDPAMYEEQADGLAQDFLQRFAALDTAIDELGEHLEQSSDSDTKDAEIQRYNELHGKLEEISNEWDVLAKEKAPLLKTMKGTINQLSELERLVFVKESTSDSREHTKENKLDDEGSERGKKDRGGFIKTARKPRGEQSEEEKKKKEFRDRTAAKRVFADAGLEPITIPTEANGVKLEETLPIAAAVSIISASSVENINTMPVQETPVQENPKKQEFLAAFDEPFESLKLKISEAKDIKALWETRLNDKKSRYSFFDLDTPVFAEYLNSLESKKNREGGEEREEAVGKIIVAEKELKELYRMKLAQLQEALLKRPKKPHARKVKATRSATQKSGPFAENTGQRASKERVYEELEKASSKIERGQCASVVIEGLKPYVEELKRGKNENPALTLKDIIEHFGVDKVAESFVTGIVEMLPSEWEEKERGIFALEFAKKEIVGYFE